LESLQQSTVIINYVDMMQMMEITSQPLLFMQAIHYN